ncbi:MAG: PAS domain S-box protein, partial [Halobacteriaceae archaeon]
MAVATDTIKILHVDDDQDFVSMTETFLEHEDDRFTVLTGTSADQGLELLANYDVDCIVSDYEMPGQNGVEFLQAVREEYPQLPFVLFTGKGSEEVASDAISAGVSDYLQKGSGSERYSLLANRIRNLIAQYHAESQLEVRAEQQQHVATLGQEALAGASPESLFERAVRKVADTLDNEYAKVLEYRPKHEDLLLQAGTGWRDGLVGEATVGIGEDSQAGHTLRSEEPIVVEDLRTEERFRGPPLLVEHDVVSGISVIIGSPDDPWGVLGTHTTEPTTFSEDDINFVQNIANVLANAINHMEREQELRRKERRYQAVFNDPNILVGLIDTDGTVLDINETALKYLDVPLDEVTGKPFWETPWFSHSETLQQDIKDWIDRANNGEYVDFEANLKRPEGDRYTVEGVFRPVMNDAGDVVSLLISDRDITEQKEYEQELKQTNALLETLFETLPVGVLVEDADRNVLTINDRMLELFGLQGAPDEFIGADCEQLAEHVSEMFVESDRFMAQINERITECESKRNEELEHKDGQTFARDYESVELPEGNGHLWVYRDITDHKEREQKREMTIDFLQSLY